MKKIISTFLAIFLTINLCVVSGADANEHILDIHTDDLVNVVDVIDGEGNVGDVEDVGDIDVTNGNDAIIFTYEQTGATYIIYIENNTFCISTFMNDILIKTTTLDNNSNVLTEISYSSEATLSDPDAISDNYGYIVEQQSNYGNEEVSLKNFTDQVKYQSFDTNTPKTTSELQAAVTKSQSLMTPANAGDDWIFVSSYNNSIIAPLLRGDLYKKYGEYYEEMAFAWDIVAGLTFEALLIVLGAPLVPYLTAQVIAQIALFVASVAIYVDSTGETLQQGLYFEEYEITDYKKVIVNGVEMANTIDIQKRYRKTYNDSNGKLELQLIGSSMSPVDEIFAEKAITAYYNEYHYPNHTYTNECATRCDVCGGGIRSVDHDYKWIYTPTQHYQECTICHKQKDLGSHHMVSWEANYNDPMYCYRYCTDDCGYFEKKTHPGWVQKWAYYGQSCTNGGDWTKTCTDCYYVSSTYIAPGSSHIGGTATCTSKANCTRCGEGYGSYASHVGGTATCTQAKVCSNCQQPYGTPLGHTPGSVPTCLSAQTCIRCTYKYQDALGHTGGTATCISKAICSRCNVSYGSVLGHTPGTAATCLTAQTCIRCTYKYQDALGHTGGTATCTAKKVCTRCSESYGQPLGHTPGGSTATCTIPQTCSRCSTTLQAALGHTGGTATCTTKKVCSRCDKSYGQPLGHTPGGSTATCTNPQTCSRCSTTLQPALGHVGGSATCTTKKVCTRCDESYGQPLGHTPGGSTATCTNPQTCSRCSTTLQPALGHTGGTATCTAAKICIRCNKSYGSSLGHTPGADATCTTAQTCKRCTYKYKNALGHSYGSWSSYDSARHRRVCTRSGCNSYESGSHYLGSNGLTCGACGRRGPFSGVSRLQN